MRLFDFQKFYFKLSLKNIKKEKKRQTVPTEIDCNLKKQKETNSEPENDRHERESVTDR